MGVVLLEGVVKPYAWGSRLAISSLLAREPSSQPEAELWMGAHAAGPSGLRSVGQAPPGKVAPQNLRELIAERPVELLGAACHERFGRLPFLLKILAAERPLSLQTHPSQEQAEAGFAREEAAGVALSAGERNYKDKSHKPELIVALSRFEALAGFRDEQDCLRTLSHFGLADPSGALGPAFARFYNHPNPEGLKAFFQELFRLSPEARAAAIDVGLVRAAALRDAADADQARTAHWFRRLAADYGSDPGVLSMLLLRSVVLEPGQALFLPARQVHSYLHGVAIEVMASSDNVLRAGLTDKHIDIKELCSVASFVPSRPEFVPAREVLGRGFTSSHYQVPAPEFMLHRAHLSGGELSVLGPVLFLVQQGELSITPSNASAVESCSQGAQGFISAQEQVTICGHGELIWASLNPSA